MNFIFFLLDISATTDIPVVDKIISLGILLTFAYFFWNKITSVENKRDADNALNQKKYEDLVNNILINMEERFTDLSKTTNSVIEENSRAMESHNSIIKSLIK